MYCSPEVNLVIGTIDNELPDDKAKRLELTHDRVGDRVVVLLVPNS